MTTHHTRIAYVAGVAAALLASAATAQQVARPDPQEIVAELRESFRERGIAKLDRVEQSELQLACSRADADGTPLPAEVAARISQQALATVKRPADGKYLGDWKAGERIAQTGRGLQFSDTAKTVNGGNCYACHQLSKAELSFGNIGTSLYQYGKLRGNSQEIIEYTWNKIYNAHTYMPCSQMPRFGDAGILTEQQLKDVMALLLDPASHVNDDNARP